MNTHRALRRGLFGLGLALAVTVAGGAAAHAGEAGPAYPPGAGAEPVVDGSGGSGGSDAGRPAGGSGDASADEVTPADGTSDAPTTPIDDPATEQTPGDEAAGDEAAGDEAAGDEETAVDAAAADGEGAPAEDGRGPAGILIVVAVALLLGGGVVAIARRI